MILPSYGDSDSHIMMINQHTRGTHVGSRASFWIGELPLAALKLPLQCQCPRATGRFLWFCGQCPALPAATSPSRLPPRRAEARSKSADAARGPGGRATAKMTSDSESDSDFGRPLPLLASSRFQGAAVAWR